MSGFVYFLTATGAIVYTLVGAAVLCFIAKASLKIMGWLFDTALFLTIERERYNHWKATHNPTTQEPPSHDLKHFKQPFTMKEINIPWGVPLSGDRLWEFCLYDSTGIQVMKTSTKDAPEAADLRAIFGMIVEKIQAKENDNA